jgi:indole-3-glycerol phosphate synthase
VLLDACTIMGTEAVVEVHTPNELEFALSKGATIFLCNNWDRMSGKLFEHQAQGMASLLPMNTVAIAAGDISNMNQIAELGFYGFDCVVLGRHIVDVPDVRDWVRDVHAFRGAVRGPGTGFKGMPFKGPD